MDSRRPPVSKTTNPQTHCPSNNKPRRHTACSVSPRISSVTEKTLIINPTTDHRTHRIHYGHLRIAFLSVMTPFVVLFLSWCVSAPSCFVSIFILDVQIHLCLCVSSCSPLLISLPHCLSPSPSLISSTVFYLDGQQPPIDDPPPSTLDT